MAKDKDAAPPTEEVAAPVATPTDAAPTAEAKPEAEAKSATPQAAVPEAKRTKKPGIPPRRGK